MIERVQPRAPLGLRPSAFLARMKPNAPAAGSVMELPLGEIAGDLHAIAGASNRSACYELMVSNDTPMPLATFAYATSASKRRDRITWNAILVPPYSAIAVEIDIALPRRGRPPRVVAELHAEDAKLTLDGGPPHRYSRGVARRATLLASAVLLLALGTASIAKNQARVVALAAPETVRGGTPFSVAYAVGHASEVNYTVATADGFEVARGSLHDGSGAFTLALPNGPRSAGYDIRIDAHGSFGSDVREAHVVALASSHVAQARLPQVRGLRLDAPTVHGGGTIAVTYATGATAGYVRLIDEIGTVRAEALLNPTGRSVLQAPYVDADQDLRIVVDAQAGSARAESEIAVRVLRGDPPPGALAQVGTLVPGLGGTPAGASPANLTLHAPDRASAPDDGVATAPVAPAASGDGDTTIQTVAPSEARGVIAVAPQQRTGQPIVVRITRVEPGLRVAVMGDGGDEIEGVDVDSSATRAILPAISSPAKHLSVVATYARGFGQETFIRPISIRN